ncbi:type IX secretion system membrane protein PorP/SprF [Pedobacter sp. SYSU D00535]|uniref:PorP/SprF family type IX secretion system membrane protein n=1 Tax=Pedobacter sp. SYSU D00535 TaxID=2810308 RepID=UPI001A958E10|nr:type IX secretion system membrane protein PorP/SprF [Pedobacter sp. SYSU D00535]
MYRNKNFLLGIVLFLAGAGGAKAQQTIQFTQYIFNSLSVNPAYAGYKEEWFAQMALRKQWAGIEDAPNTGQISLDGVLDPERKRMGLGLQIGADKLGAQSTTSLYLNYAYRLQLNEEDTKRLSFGIGAGLSQYALDYSKLNPIDGGDQYATQGESSNFVPDFRFGIYYYSPKWYAGASVLDLLANGTNGSISSDELSQGAIKHKRHVYFQTGMLFNLNPEIKLRPSLLAKEDFKGPTSVDLNTMLIFKERIWIGASYRTSAKLWEKKFEDGLKISKASSIAGVAQLFISDAFRVGYSYDYSMNQLNDIESGSHEITLGLTLARRSYRLLSPRFF